MCHVIACVKRPVVTNKLTLKLSLLGAMSVFVWGLSYARALKRGITIIAEIALRQPGLDLPVNVR